MHNRTDRLLFLVTLACCLFWITAQLLNVYAARFTGLFFELLSLPTLLAGAVCFFISCINWVREKFRLLTCSFGTILLVMLTILLIWLLNSPSVR